MKAANTVLGFAFLVGMMGCETRTSQAPTADADWEQRVRAPGTNAGSDKQLMEEVAGWTYHLAAGQDRIAAYQFNESGTVVATVGEEGKLGYPAMFWRIDENNQIVVADEWDFEVAAELWTVLSIRDRVITVSNAVYNREETYVRKRHWPPSARSTE